jgi:hypothetical protein
MARGKLSNFGSKKAAPFQKGGKRRPPSTSKATSKKK